MTSVAITAPRPARRPATALVAVGLIAASFMTVLAQHPIRLLETRLAGGFLRLSGASHVGSLGTNVLFSAHSRYVGIAIDTGCSAAFLMAPFLVLGAALLATGRISIRRSLVSIAIAVGITFVTNQVRIGVIAISIRHWGLTKGYERSHVLLGTVVSTVGVLIGVLLFFFLATRGTRPGQGRGSQGTIDG